jgi:hypothetical protein
MWISRHGAKLCSLSLALIVAACGGDGGSSDESAQATSNSASGGSPNAAPTILGQPPSAALADTQYTFQPNAADPDGDVVTFRIRQKPAWASFSEATGQLHGTPRGADIGLYAGIVITATDGAADAALDAFDITVNSVGAGSATLSWLPPTENTDGSALTDLAGFKIYWGTTPGVYSSSLTVDNPGLTAYVVDNLVPATYYFVATAVNADGIESAASNVASGQVM